MADYTWNDRPANTRLARLGVQAFTALLFIAALATLPISLVLQVFGRRGFIYRYGTEVVIDFSDEGLVRRHTRRGLFRA